MYELTSMQSACWFGRISDIRLGGVSAHLYIEFDGRSINPHQLNLAIQRLYQVHDILRMRLSNQGVASISSYTDQNFLEIEDFSILNSNELEQALLQKRENWTHQQLDLANGQSAKFSISLLKNSYFRFHIDADMIAIDPSSLRRLIEDLSLFYKDPDITISKPPAFFKWYDQIQNNPDLKKLRRRDQLWWKARLCNIAPSPSIPLATEPAPQAISYRLSTWLSPKERQSLKKIAQQQHITISSLAIGLFAYTLGNQTQDKSFRLNIPIFWREPILKDIQRSVGDFANLTILDIQMQDAKNLTSLCKQIANQLTDLLEHSYYPGVNILRDLSRYYGRTELAPVVFTAALDLVNGDLFSKDVHDSFGAMNWAISQGPQVALDAQMINLNGGILINWDARLDALPKAWISDLFKSFSTLLKNLATDPKLIDSIEINRAQALLSQKPLTALQQAYLLGRTKVLPLGGVAMQEYRQYSGKMDTASLRQRLTEMVKRHQSLRTFIDTRKLVQYVSDQIVVNLKEIDMSELPLETALKQIQSFKNEYSHALFDLNHSPWDVTVFLLNNHTINVLVRFDALILDGRSIATLMLELFNGYLHNIEISISQEQNTNHLSVNPADIVFWEHKISRLSVSCLQLPWTTPLQHLTTSRYRRKTLVIKKDPFQLLTKIAAKQTLFKNSMIMAIILEVLSHWNASETLYVAVPTLPLYTGAFSNSSTFIVVDWEHSEQLIEQARRLQQDILQSLQHLSFSGVDLARLLFEKTKLAPVLPVVITNGLSWPTLPESHCMQQQDGLTQTPQVAIDIRFSMLSDGGLVFNIDYAEQAISSEMIQDFLHGLSRAFFEITHSNIFQFNLTDWFLEIQNNRAYFGNSAWSYSNQSLNASSPPLCELIKIYSETLGATQYKVDNLTSFTLMGLRPHHLKMISKRIKEVYEVDLAPTQLIHCQNIEDVKKLLKQY